jgi:5-methyltetrahydrofolate--homocysteine methyltransferase
VEKLMSRLAHGEVLVADGAMGTMLMDRGLESGQPPESFNLTHGDALQEIARAYLDAGADIIQTNTFGASGLKLASFSLGKRIREINRNAVLAVKKVVGERAYVSGSCGPTGRFLKPYGDVELEEMSESFREQISALTDAGVDAVCVETMMDLKEATCAIRAAKTVAPSKPVMATMTFDVTPKGFFTVMGVTIEQAAKGLEAAGADIIGSNCGNGIEKMVSIAQEFKRYTKLPVMIQANAGIPTLKGDEVIYPETPDFMAEKAEQLISLGVSIIGGCCGTTPAHTSALRKKVDSYGHQAG